MLHVLSSPIATEFRNEIIISFNLPIGRALISRWTAGMWTLTGQVLKIPALLYMYTVYFILFYFWVRRLYSSIFYEIVKSSDEASTYWQYSYHHLIKRHIEWMISYKPLLFFVISYAVHAVVSVRFLTHHSRL